MRSSLNDTTTPTSERPRARVLFTAAIALAAISPLGCQIGSKSVGSEPEDSTESSGDDGVDDGADDGVDDGADDGQTTPGGSSDDAGPGDGSDGSTGQACGEPPPIELAECVACDPSERSYTNAACTTSCAGQPCGEPCLACPDEQPTCLEAQYVGACDNAGQCIVPGGPDLCMNVLQPGFETELTEQGGCADLHAFARNAEDTIGLILRVDADLVATVVDSGEPMATDIEITAPSVMLRVDTGVFVTEAQCNDAIGNETVVEDTWLATAGVVTLELTPDGNGNAIADLTLSNVTLERETPGVDPIEIESYVFSDVVVGWLPG